MAMNSGYGLSISDEAASSCSRLGLQPWHHPWLYFFHFPPAFIKKSFRLQLQHVLDTCAAWPWPSRLLTCRPASLPLRPCLPQSGCVRGPYRVLPRPATLQHLPLPSEWEPRLKVLRGPTCLSLNSLTLSPPALPLPPTTWTISRAPQAVSPLRAARHLGSLPYLLYTALLPAHLLGSPCPDHPPLQPRLPFRSLGPLRLLTSFSALPSPKELNTF